MKVKRGSVFTAGSMIALLGLGACAGVNQAENPFSQSPYLWPATYQASTAPGARAATATTVFTVRTSDWLDNPAEAKALIAQQCGPMFKTARVFRHDTSGSPLRPVELVVYCGDLKPRVAVYPEPGTTGLSDSLSTLDQPVLAADRGELVTLP